MNKLNYRIILPLIIFVFLTACSHHHQPEKEPESIGSRGEQYRDAHIIADFRRTLVPNTEKKVQNSSEYISQIITINDVSPNLYAKNNSTYHAVIRWLNQGGDVKKLAQFGIRSYQMKGVDGNGNVRFTGYYTPIIDARRTRDNHFKYPIYGFPYSYGHRLPSRAQIHNGALDGRNLELAYSDSRFKNFMMGVQGSAYINFADNTPLTLFSYAGKNGHPYISIGRVLVDRGELLKEEVSMQTIKAWIDTHSEAEQLALLNQNPSFVFFTPNGPQQVTGSAGIPLITRASVAVDNRLIAPGTSLLMEVPLLDNTGKFIGQYELRLVIALDVGGAIKGHHIDIYQGIGQQAGEYAGWYNHFGRVWVLSSPGDNMDQLLRKEGW